MMQRILTDMVSDIKKKQTTQTQKITKPSLLFCCMNTFASEDLKTPDISFSDCKKIQLEKYGEGQRNGKVFIILWRNIQWYYHIWSLTKKEEICFTIICN